MFAGVFSGGGEGLESGYGSYKLSKDMLIIIPPASTEIDGWPSRDGNHFRDYRCYIEMNKGKNTFILDSCGLSGAWTKVE